MREFRYANEAKGISPVTINLAAFVYHKLYSGSNFNSVGTKLYTVELIYKENNVDFTVVFVLRCHITSLVMLVLGSNTFSNTCPSINSVSKNLGRLNKAEKKMTGMI